MSDSKPPRKPIANQLDRAIAVLAPVFAARRMQARMQIAQAERIHSRGYDAAGTGRRFASIEAAGSASAITEIAWALPVVRDRHRELVRNNPWAGSAVRAISALMVGAGIHVEFKHEGTNKEWTKGTDRFNRWFGSKQCDANGKLDGYGIQALIARAVAESGECIIRRRRRTPADKLMVPMQLQVMEGDFLDHSRNEFLPNGRGAVIVNGVQYSAIGKIEGYYLFDQHPGDYLVSANRGGVSRFVTAADVIHCFRVDRPGQVRGMPWGSNVILSLMDLDGYEDAYLFRNKLANCFTAFVSPGLDSGYKASATDLTRMNTVMEPGAIELVPMGSSFALSTPPKADDYGGFTSEVSYRVAAGYGLSHATLTGRVGEVNFTSGRMGWITENRNVDQWRWHMLIPQALDVISDWFFQADELGNGNPMEKYEAHWAPPRRELLDPGREVRAARDAIQAGLSSETEWHRERGMSRRKVYAELEEERKDAADKKLTISSDYANIKKKDNPNGSEAK